MDSSDSDNLIKHGTLMFVATSIANVANYVFHVLMGRMLGPADYGILMSLISLLMIISVPAGAFQTVITKYVSQFKAKEEYAKINRLILVSAKRLFWCGLLAFLVLALLSGYVAAFLRIPSRVPVIVLGLVLLVSIILPVLSGGLQGLQIFEHLGGYIITGGVLRVVFGVLLVSLGLGVSGAIGASALSTAIVLVLAFVSLRFIYGWKDENVRLNSSEMYRYFWPVLATVLCFMVLTNTDIILVKHFFSPVEAGHYSAAAVFGKIVLFLPAAIVMVMFPKTSELHALEKDSSLILWKSLLGVGFLCGVVTAGYFLFPRLIVSVLFGVKYLSAVPLIGLFGLAMTFFSLVNILIFYHLSVHNLRFIYALVACTLLQVGAIWVFHRTLMQVLYILIGSGILLILVNEYFLFIPRYLRDYARRRRI